MFVKLSYSRLRHDLYTVTVLSQDGVFTDDSHSLLVTDPKTQGSCFMLWKDDLLPWHVHYERLAVYASAVAHLNGRKNVMRVVPEGGVLY